MNFFEAQHQAKKKTGRLVFYFGMAVLFLVVANHFILATALAFANKKKGRAPDWDHLLDPSVMLLAVLGTGLIVGLASLFKNWELRSGGAAVASLMGGRLLDAATREADERKLLNVVEEMSIASSTPRPDVYVLDHEEGINAFAAGHVLDDAVVGVTRGCMEKLSREELQGVIAHEFSHILNQDMKLNVRLIAVVHGILFLALIGGLIMRVGGYGSYGYSRSRDRQGGAAVAFFLVGLGVMVAGYVGVFFGRLIKSAVSRQREYLADASAVQFTRNPDGLAGALKKIGALSQGSRIQSRNAEEISHMFFGNGLKHSWFNAMSTHPPLLERIQLVDPSFDGDFSRVRFPQVPEGESDDPPPGRSDGPPRVPGIRLPGVGEALGRTGLPIGLMAAAPMRMTSPAQVADSVGALAPEHLDFASALLESIPENIREAAREPFGASALVYALLLSSTGTVLQEQRLELERRVGKPMAREVDGLSDSVRQLDPRAKLPVADLAIGALKRLSPDQFAGFKHMVELLVRADHDLDLFEYALQKLVMRHLDPHFDMTKRRKIEHRTLNRLDAECSVLLSALAHIGHEDDAMGRSAFDLAVAQLPTGLAVRFVEFDKCDLAGMDRALDQLATTAPPLRRQILQAAAAAVSADGVLTSREAELLRAIADTLDCPLPPLEVTLQAA